MTGLSAVIGSWKIIDMRLPRSARRRARRASKSSSPSRRIEPAAGVSCGASRPMVASAVTDLPEPDSPTTQTSSRGRTAIVTSSMANGRSAPAGRRTVRPRMSRTGSAGRFVLMRSHLPRDARIEAVAQAIAENIHGEHGESEQQARQEQDPGRDLEEGAGLGDHVAPAWDLGWRPSTEKAQDRFENDSGGADVGRLHDERRDGV